MSIKSRGLEHEYAEDVGVEESDTSRDTSRLYSSQCCMLPDLARILRSGSREHEERFCCLLQGTADEVVDVSHGRELAQLAKKPFDPLWVNGGKHCDLEFYPNFLSHLRKFVLYVDQNPPPPRAA